MSKMIVQALETTTTAHSVPATTSKVRVGALPIGYDACVHRLEAAVADVAVVTFLWTYSALHVAHVAGRDLALVRSIAAIPLFAIVVASTVVGALAGLVASLVLRHVDWRPGPARRLLWWSIGLFAATMALLP